MLSEYLLEKNKISVESASGDAFKGIRISDNARVVAKFNTDSSAASSSRFQRENDILYNLMPHDGIIEPLTHIFHGTHQGLTGNLYVMRCADTNLEDWIFTDDANYETSLDVFKQTCVALKHAHDNGYIHRDLHIRNVLLNTDPSNIAKLIDFGRAYDFNTEVNLSEPPFWGGLVMPPEVRFGIIENPNSHEYIRGDIFALGVMWRCLFEKSTTPIHLLFNIISNMNLFIAQNSPEGDMRRYYTDTTLEFRKSLYWQWLENNSKQLEPFFDIQLLPIDRAERMTTLCRNMANFDMRERLASVDDILISLEGI